MVHTSCGRTGRRSDRVIPILLWDTHLEGEDEVEEEDEVDDSVDDDALYGDEEQHSRTHKDPVLRQHGPDKRTYK